MCSLSVNHHLVNMKLGSQEIQGIAKDWGQKKLFQVLQKNGDQLIKNLSCETIFLATTLNVELSKFSWNII